MILPRPILLDANALIYLDKIGIVRKVISLLSENGADPFTTNLVKQEMKVPSWKVLEGCGMKWHEVSWSQMCAAGNMHVRDYKLSMADASLAVVASEMNVVLVTADGLLSEYLVEIGGSVMNFPEFLDALATDGLLTIDEAISAFTMAKKLLHCPPCDAYLKKYRDLQK